MHPLPRALHPAAWWGWAVGMAVAVSLTTNPLLLVLAFASAWLVVVSRRGSWPWARAFHLYVWLGGFVIALRVVIHVLVGDKVGSYVVLPLPSVALPSWAAGVELGGVVYLEGLLATVSEALRLATMIACVGAANALANPKRLLRSLPGSLQEIGAAVVVSVTVAPQLAESVQRVRAARALRGEEARGIRALPRVAIPVLEDTLERSLSLAAAMDSRGYGRERRVSRRERAVVSAVNLVALLAVALGLYGVLDPGAPAPFGLALLAAGVVLAAVGIGAGGRGRVRTTYRPDPWAGPEWLTLGCGLAAAAGLVLTRFADPLALTMPLTPLAVPALPFPAVAGLLLGALPAVLTPRPPAPPPRVVRRGAPAEVAR